MAIFRQEPRNGGVECRCGRQKLRFWAYIWLHCLLLTLQQARCCQHGRRWTVATVPKVMTLLFHDLLLSPISQHSVWSELTCHNSLHWTVTKRGHNRLISLVVYCGYAVIRPPRATRDNQSPSPWFYSVRATERALALYTITIDHSKARRYAKDNRTEPNCTHW